MARQPFKPFGPPKPAKGKSSQSEMLPSRHALAQLTGGDPSHRNIGYYGKLTPLGSGAPGRYQDIQAMGEKFKDEFGS